MDFVEKLNLFWVAESWGGHVSLMLPVNANRELAKLPDGVIMRFHAGLESEADLLRDLEQASGLVFPRLKNGVEKRLFPS